MILLLPQTDMLFEPLDDCAIIEHLVTSIKTLIEILKLATTVCTCNFEMVRYSDYMHNTFKVHYTCTFESSLINFHFCI